MSSKFFLMIPDYITSGRSRGAHDVVRVPFWNRSEPYTDSQWSVHHIVVYMSNVIRKIMEMEKIPATDEL